MSRCSKIQVLIKLWYTYYNNTNINIVENNILIKNNGLNEYIYIIQIIHFSDKLLLYDMEQVINHGARDRSWSN